VEFLVSLNPGFDPGPLSRVASGGELSRIMLALKSILAGIDAIPSLIFDEIDAGIGGEVALRVAEKLKDVASHHQVFVITHLPQLAAKADQQLLVEKGETGGMASTRVRELDAEERVKEVARMLGGDPSSFRSLDHARELLGDP
jgi:DNA repair protein RecN (Recombination protein N)